MIWLGVLGVATLDRVPWGDERHYVGTVRMFGRGMGLEPLRTYGELAPPLAFALYAWWGRLVGFELPRLRLLSLLIALATVMAVHALARRVLRHDRDAVLAALFFLVHPYTIGLSVFVFNDMLAILCAVLLAIGVAVGRPALVVLGSAAGLMTRQYFAFLTVAAALHCAIRWARWRRTGDLALLAGLLASCLPLAGLFLLWHGLGPASAPRELYLSRGLSFEPAALTLYVTQLFTYLCPLLLLRPRSWAHQFRRQWLWIGECRSLTGWRRFGPLHLRWPRESTRSDCCTERSGLRSASWGHPRKTSSSGSPSPWDCRCSPRSCGTPCLDERQTVRTCGRSCRSPLGASSS